MPCIDPENTPLPGDLENVLLRKLLNRLCNISSGGGGGGVSQAYVDARDAATLASANAFSSAGLAGKENVANKSTDGTFAANSDTLYPSQRAAKTYVDNAITVTAAGLYVLKAGDTMTGALLLPNGAVGAPSLSHTADANTGLWFPAADTIAISTSGIEQLRIDPAGNVGIGATPDSKLYVQAGAVAGLRVGFGGTSLNIYDADVHRFRAISGVEALRIIANGNVGIGITAPLARLHVTPSASGTDYFRIDHSDGTPRHQFGSFTAATTLAGIWLGNITPNNNNYTLLGDGTDAYLGAPGVFYFAPGSTAAWKMSAAGHLVTQTDNTVDIGAAGANRPRNYFGAGTVNAAGGLITGNVAALVTSSAAMNNGAAAALGTLTDAPVAGNPTKWVPIDDNGTTRYVPAW